jgi:hypothetical protein
MAAPASTDISSPYEGSAECPPDRDPALGQQIATLLDPDGNLPRMIAEEDSA